MKMNKWKIATFALTALFMSMYMLGTVSSLAEEPQYQDAEVLVDLSLLPGVRINLWFNQEIDVFSDETTHVQHGFVSNSPWDEMSAAEQTEFLSTTKFRFFHSNEEVPLNHIIRYNTYDSHMYSMFYRVFPPGFFPVGQNQIRGEWSWLESGSWIVYEDTGTVKISKAGVADNYEPNNNITEANNLGNVFIADIDEVRANIFPSTEVDWYSFHTIDGSIPGTEYPLHIFFDVNPEGTIAFDVWKSDTSNFSDAVQVHSGTWYSNYGTMGVDDSAYYWVMVYNNGLAVNYEDYHLLIKYYFHP
jgi:hypothetical protein